MYVVRRSFKNFGEAMLPGSIVEPGSIKRFKTRLNDRYIVEVHAQDFDKWNKYFKDKLGVEIKLPEEKTEEKPESTEGTEGTSAGTPEQAKAQPARVVVTAK